MKHFLVAASVALFLFSCKKQNNILIDSAANRSLSFFQTVKAQLKDSLSAFDYASLDANQFYKSREVQIKGCFVRIGMLNKNMATDFILLKTDSLGNIRAGKMIHVDKDGSNRNTSKFTGRFSIASFDKTSTRFRSILNGKLKSVHNATDLMEADPSVGEQTLPDCVITCYTADGGNEGDWYLYDGFFDDYDGGGGGYTYGYSGGGGASSNGAGDDKTMVIQVESNNEPPIKLSDYLKCFSTVPDANATYQITLYADIPVNGDPSQLFNITTGEVGHSFIQLRKVNGGMSVQQNIGFYPQTSWKSLSSLNVSSKVVDNEGHEFNASLTASLNNVEFQAALNKIQSISSRDYNIETWNCTDFALAVFNAANTGETLTVPQYPIPGTDTYSNTPQALYVTVKSMKDIGNDSYGVIDIPGVLGWVGESHGSCGN